MRGMRAAACVLPLMAGLAMGLVEIADWPFWGANPREAAPLLWRGLDWMLYPFAIAGLPLLAPTTWMWGWISPILSRLYGPVVAQNGACFTLIPGLLLGFYLAVRGRSMFPGDMMRASFIGSSALVLFGLLSALSIKGSTDGQAGIGLVMVQNGGLVVAVLAVEWIRRRGGQRLPD